MASIYLYNKNRCLELNNPRIEEEDIKRLKSVLPSHLEGIAFVPPENATEPLTSREYKTESQEVRVADYLKNIGNKLEQLHQVKGAVRFYDLAFRLNPNGDLLLMKARALSQHGEAEQADQLLNQYLKRDPLDPKPYVMLGKMAFGRSDYQVSKRYFEKALERARGTSVNAKDLGEVIQFYLKIIGIYLDRDQLFSRSLSSHECLIEIQSLHQRTQSFFKELKQSNNSEVQGLEFYVEGLEKTFEKWVEEMKGV